MNDAFHDDDSYEDSEPDNYPVSPFQAYMEEPPEIELGADSQEIPTYGLNPVSDIVGANQTLLGPVPARRRRRMIAKFIDHVIVFVAFFGGLIGWELSRAAGAPPVYEVWVGVVFFGVPAMWIVWFIYNTALKGNTIGKRMLRMQVVTDEGTKLSFGRAFARSWGESLSASLLGLGYLFAIDRKRRTMHDRLCGTRVVMKRQ